MFTCQTLSLYSRLEPPPCLPWCFHLDMPRIKSRGTKSRGAICFLSADNARGGGTGGGQGGHGPPKNLSGWAKVCFGPPPPQNFDHWPPQNGRPVVKTFAKLLLSTLKSTKFSKFFRLRRANMGKVYSSCDFMLFQSEFFYLVIFFST